MIMNTENPDGTQPQGCEFCDHAGGAKTYAHQVCMPLNGRVLCIDRCIHHIVAALNAGGVETAACCCGHREMQGRIDLADGRTLWIENPVKPEDAIAMVSRKHPDAVCVQRDVYWFEVMSGTDSRPCALGSGESPDAAWIDALKYLAASESGTKNEEAQSLQIAPEPSRSSLLAETQETAERLNKLNAFMASAEFPKLPREDKDLLYSQQRTMSELVQILGKRLERCGQQFEHSTPTA
jgi:hypothetical protein